MVSIILASMVLIGFNMIVVMIKVNSSITDIVIIMVAAIILYMIMKKYMIFYKYTIIEEELIIHEIIGSKEKVSIDINIHQIITFKNIDEESYELDKTKSYESKSKLYNSANQNDRYYLIYEENQQMKWVIFQPSNYMVKLLEELIN